MHVSRLILRFVLLVVSHPRLTLALTLTLVGASAWLALVRLTISTDQNKLFSEKVPFFRDYLEFDRKFPENEAVYLVVETRDPSTRPSVGRWTAAADALVEAMRKLPEYVASVDARVPIHELGEQGLLFDDPQLVRQTLHDVREMLPMVRWFAEKPGLDATVFGRTPLDQFLGKLSLAPPDPRLAGFVGEVARSLNATAAKDRATLPDLASLDAADPSRLGYYYVPDETDRTRHLLLVRVYPRKDFASLTGNARKIEKIRAAASHAIAQFGEFKVGTTGRPALEADEMVTTDRDTTRAEILALSAVFIGMALLLRSVYLAFVAELSLGVGIAWTFGWATLVVGQLNLLSIVFLLALIGIGLDYLVQILSRYRREMARRQDRRLVWVAVFRQVGPPINTACMGAAGAFLVSLFTDFRGAAELGVIAGGGLLLCLLSGYTFLPALLTMLPARTGQLTTETQRHGKEIQERKAFFVGPLVWVALLLVGLIWAFRTGFNPSLLELQAQKLDSVKLVRKLQTWSAVVLSRDLEDLRKAREALAGARTVARTESILTAYDNAAWLRANAILPEIAWSAPVDVTSNDLARLAQKAKNLAARFDEAPEKTADTRTAAEQLRRLSSALTGASASAIATRLSHWQRQFQAQLHSLLRAFNPGDPDVARLPLELRSHYVSADGTYALYIHPAQDLWDHSKLDEFVIEVERRLKTVIPGATLTGIAHNIHHSTSSIRASFYRATFYALGLIVLLVLIDLRRIGHTLLAISVLGLGLPMLVALMGLFGVDWNFANFFGLPIIIGAGHEYGVFMVHRYRESLHNPRRGWGRWDVADAALLLCAFITSCSFFCFWIFANHQGLKSLGWVMAVGTACIYLATVIALRPLLKYLLRRS